MERFLNWDESKNRQLMRQRRISFEDVAVALDRGDVIATVNHPNQERYPGQMIYVADIDDYLYLVPFVTEPDGTMFLKTIIPSRKAMRRYGRR